MLPNVVYRLYERRLLAELRTGALPRHIGVVLDGNRRWARARGLPSPAEGHRMGADKVHALLDWCDELAIPYVTLWLLSTENLRRDEREISDLMDIIADTVRRVAEPSERRQRQVRVVGVGALDVLPDELRRAVKDAEETTADHDGTHVQIAVGYGGRQEIIDALRALLSDRQARGRSLEDVIDELSPELISEHLYTTGTPDPDLIIRTSGEIRLSGFLLWQSAHSEFYFCDPYWPEFRKTDFLRALRDFASRQRRYGR
ncbi:MAG: isoprenyl transferase [Egibacteraceae bacterium]